MNAAWREGEKATKPASADDVCERGTGHFISRLTMGYGVAARGRSRASFLIREYGLTPATGAPNV